MPRRAFTLLGSLASPSLVRSFADIESELAWLSADGLKPVNSI